MKKISFSILILIIAFGYSCVKNRNSINTDFGSLKPFLELRAPDFPTAGAPNFAGIDHFDNADIDGLTAGNDTVLFYVNIASVNTFNNPTNVTVGVDEKLIKTFNDTSQLEYTVLPAFAYKQLDKTVVIPAHERIAQIRVVFKKDLFNQLDPTLNYMLPITILKNDGIDVSLNEGTVWFHKIGNCIAGDYNVTGSEKTYNIFSNGDTVLSSNYDLSIFTPTKSISAVSSSVAQTPYATKVLLGSDWYYLISFDCLSNTILDLRPNEVMYSNIRINSFKLLQPPTYNSQTETFHFVTSYVNGSNGQYVVVEETLTKQ